MDPNNKLDQWDPQDIIITILWLVGVAIVGTVTTYLGIPQLLLGG